jgi:outer membrane protein assembly factor BamA
MLRPFLLGSLLFICSGGYAQHTYVLKIHVSDKDSAFIKKNITYSTSFADTLSARKQVLNVLNNLYGMGFLYAHADSIKINFLHVNAYLTIGNVMKWVRLKALKIDPILLEHVGFKEKFYNGKIYNYKQIAALDESIIAYCENNGYPFASVKLDSVKITGDSIAARLVVSKNKLIFIDSIHVVGDVKISKNYLYNYFDIKPGSPYDETKIRAIAQKLKEIQFLSEQKHYTVVFNDTRATIYLYLKNKTASTLNFLIGFAPNTNGGLLITGQGQLYLSNPLGHGESLNINFNEYPGGTAQFQSEVNFPYILSLPIGADLALNIYKQDSTYLNVDETLGIKYLLTGANYIKAFYKNQSSIALTLDTSAIISTHTLPSIMDVSTGYYGLELFYEKLNYLYNPSRGYTLDISAAVGERHVREDARILQLQDPDSASFNFASLYDTVKLNSISYNLSWSIYKYFPIKQRNVIKTGISGAAIIDPGAQIYTDELFEIGGINNIRGFDENSIYASKYCIYTLEYRYLLGQNSYFSIFNDDAYVDNNSEGNNTQNFYVGIGTGLAFETKAGIFNISYAIGRSNGTTFQFNSAKIQFGYVNYF